MGAALGFVGVAIGTLLCRNAIVQRFLGVGHLLGSVVTTLLYVIFIRSAGLGVSIGPHSGTYRGKLIEFLELLYGAIITVLLLGSYYASTSVMMSLESPCRSDKKARIF